MARNAPSARGSFAALVVIVPPTGGLGGCGSSAASGRSLGLADLAGRSFTADTVEDLHHSLVPGTQVQLSFTDGRLTARAGCNTMAGAISLDNGTLVTSRGLAVTEMGCPEPRMKQDEWLANLLTGRPHVTLDGDQLVLSRGATTLTLTQSR